VKYTNLVNENLDPKFDSRDCRTFIKIFEDGMGCVAGSGFVCIILKNAGNLEEWANRDLPNEKLSKTFWKNY
jgi:hypothetical protein